MRLTFIFLHSSCLTTTNLELGTETTNKIKFELRKRKMLTWCNMHFETMFIYVDTEIVVRQFVIL